MSDAPPPSAGLCVDCRHAEVVASARSRYLRCARSDSAPAFARYPHLPVLDCRGFEQLRGEERLDRSDAAARR